MPTLMRILWGRRPLITAIRAFVLGIAAYFFFSTVIRPLRIHGRSMEPTVPDATFRFANMMAYRYRTPQRGDIVVIARSGSKVMYMKRVLGLPGETIAFDNGILLIDNRIVEEPYLDYSGNWTMSSKILGTEDYFVAGDNRVIPLDAHVIGRVNIRSIRGRLLL